MKNPPDSVAHLDFVAGIPTLDLSHFTHGTDVQRQAFVNDLGAAHRMGGKERASWRNQSFNSFETI